MHLCEFIEDCEFSELIVQILHIIGSVGPTTPSPSRYIRFVFNRVILENALVRAAAITTLGSFASKVKELRPSIAALLARSLGDEDDEVRDRAVVLLQILSLASDNNNNSSEEEGKENCADLHYLMDEKLPMSFTSLERSVKAFLAHPSYTTSFVGSSTQRLTFSTLPIVEEAYVPTSLPNVQRLKKKNTTSTSLSVEEEEEAAADTGSSSTDLYKIPEFSSYGRIFRSTGESSLTETEMEYVVSYVRHVYESHVVLQFKILNTIDDQQLRDAVVHIDLGEHEHYSVVCVLPAPVVRYGEQTSCYVGLQRTGAPIGLTCSCELSFKMLQVDPTTGSEVEGSAKGGFEEEYPLENLEINTHDFMAKVSVGDFRRSWEQLGGGQEVLEKFSLQFKRLEEAVTATVDLLGMQPVDGTGLVPPSESTGARKPHILHLSGVFIGNIPVLARAQLQLEEGGGNLGVVLKLAVRSSSKEVNQLVAECIQ